MEVKTGGGGGAAGRSTSPSPAQATPIAPSGTRVLGRQDSTSAAGSFDAWLVQKLKAEWSSDELGALLTRERIVDALASFPQLENPIKARLLLSFLSMRPDEAADCRDTIKELLALAEDDSEEWVRIGAGMVNQFQFMDANGKPGDSFFHDQLAKTTGAIVDAVADPSEARERTLDDFLSLENALLNPSIRAEIALKPAKHFTVIAPPPDANGKGSDRDDRHPKKPLHRPQMARPLLHPSSSSGATAPTRLTPTSTKPPAPKKNVSDVTSEIRRKADAGRFKRQRSRISMIDIDEVKQIESEKAQKAEERKKQKLLAKEKEKSAAAGAAATGQAGAASDNAGEEASPASASAGASVSGNDNTNTDASAGANSTYEEHSDQQDTVSEDEQSGSVEPSGHADAGYEPDTRGGLYAADGARALLNAAAFHSSQDAVVQQEHRQLHHQQPQQLPPYQPVYHQQHSLPPPPQFQHRGFEPEDAGSHMSFGGYDFGSHNTATNSSSAPGYYGDQMGSYRPAQEASPYGAYMSDPRQAQVPGNAAAQGFYPLPDQRGAFDPNAQRQQQQQQQQPRQQHGGYMDGPPEYWR